MSFRADAASPRSRWRRERVARRWCHRPAARRAGADCRRASRTESGKGSHPASRPNSTSGGATGEVCMTSPGGPTTSGPPVAWHQDDPVGERHDPLQPVFRHAPRSDPGRAPGGRVRSGPPRPRPDRAPTWARRGPAPAAMRSAPRRWPRAVAGLPRAPAMTGRAGPAGRAGRSRPLPGGAWRRTAPRGSPSCRPARLPPSR